MLRIWAVKSVSLGLLCASVGFAQNNVLSPVEAQQGFQLIFDGNIASYRSHFVNYVKNNANNTNLDAGWVLNSAEQAVTMTSGSLPDTRSVKMYRDFDLRMDYRNNGNQGVIYRHLLTGAFPWETGVEFSIDDNVNQSPKVRVGAPYDLYPMPAATYYKTYSTNQWNSLRIVVKADSVEHWLNGTKVAGFKYNSTAFWSAVTASKWNTYNNFCTSTGQRNSYIRQGYIGIQGDHGGTWLIRNFRILHDSLDSQDRVTLGEVITTVDAKQSLDKKKLLQTHSRGGELELDFPAGTQVRTIEMLGLNGRVFHPAFSRKGDSKVILETAGLDTGLYFVRAETRSGAQQAKIYIP